MDLKTEIESIILNYPHEMAVLQLEILVREHERDAIVNEHKSVLETIERIATKPQAV